MSAASVDKYSFVALVTGASRGLGFELVKQLAFGTPAGVTPLFGVSDGALELPDPIVPADNAVILAACRSPATATELAALAARSNGRLQVVQLDVGSDEDIAAVAAQIDAEYGRLDLLIHNAGIIETGLTLRTLSRSDINRIYDTNVTAPLLITKALLPVLSRTLADAAAKGGFEPLKASHPTTFNPNNDGFVERSDVVGFAQKTTDLIAGGPPKSLTEADRAALAASPVKVIFMSSTLGSIASNLMAAYPVYRSTKSALNMVARSLTVEEPGLAVATVHPGWVETEGGKQNKSPINPPVKIPDSIAGLLEVIKRVRADELPWGIKAFDGYTWPF